MKAPLPMGSNYSLVKKLISEYNLHTICSSGNCPNKAECWSAGTATFMILGDICTRNCSFCFVKTAKSLPADENEPDKIAEIIKILKLKHCVITSVNRDDLPDQGAGIWAMTIKKVKIVNPGVTMEVLIPDFRGDKTLIQKIINEKPEVISHNVETIKRLTPLIRSRADYETSLEVLKYVSDSGVPSKSGLMLGLGESTDEVLQTMDDLRLAGVTILTLGQYLRPSDDHYNVEEYIHPATFEKLKAAALEKGFSFVESGPLVRSSYHAERHV